MTVDQWIALALGAPTALSLIWSALLYIPKRLGSIDDRITVIETQHQNNGGSTMKDAVDRIEASQKDLAEKFQAHLLDSARRGAELETTVKILAASSPAAAVVVQTPPASPPASS